jgi:hypothetical protein
MTLITRGCRRAIRTGTEELTRDLLDQVRNDAAAEAARQELLAASTPGGSPPAPPPPPLPGREPWQRPADAVTWVQLWLALPGASGSPGPARLSDADEQETVPAVSPHCIDPAQQALFDMCRDWGPVLGSAGLPALTEAAQRLLDDFSRAQPSPGAEAAGKSARALRILAAWLGADAPLHEADVRALARLRPGVQVRRVLTFLAARNMLIPDPGRQAEPRQHAVQRLLTSLPGQIGHEAGIWVRVVRGQGRVEHPALAYKTIRNYLAYLLPVLTSWAIQYTSLREVTRHDILDAIDARHGPVIQHRIVALRSLFRVLRQERVMFRDPTRGISLPAPARLPQPLPADRVAGRLNCAEGPAARLAVALVAIHAVPEADLVRLQATDLDLTTGTLTIRRGLQRRMIYLDEVTAALASQWLRNRHSAGPAAATRTCWSASRLPPTPARSAPP